MRKPHRPHDADDELPDFREYMAQRGLSDEDADTEIDTDAEIGDRASTDDTETGELPTFEEFCR